MGEVVEMIDRVVLHGSPELKPSMILMHAVPPYDGEPKLTVTRQMRQLQGVLICEVSVVFYYSHTDGDGLPHYIFRGT